MTKAEITRLRGLIDEVNDNFILITNSQMSFCNTPSTPIIFDDTHECIYHFKRSHREGPVPYSQKRIEVLVTTYDAIENIEILKQHDDMITLATGLGVDAAGLDRIREAFKRNHGEYINNNENVIK